LVHHYLKPGGVFIIAEGRVSVATIDNMILVAYDLGYLEICGEDLEFMIPKESGGLAQLFAEIAKRQPSPNNKGVARVADFLDGWLKEHGGFEEINDRKIYIPLGWEGSTDLCKEPHRAGQLMLENARVSPHVCSRTSTATDHGNQSNRFLRAPGSRCSCLWGCLNQMWISGLHWREKS
jgi:hypothetical protein